MINVFQTRFANTTLKQHNLIESLGQATQNILHNAFYLAKQKLELSRSEYKQLLQEWGWEKEDKKYLKLAQTFEKFSPLDLAEVEPDTLFLLSKHHKKYLKVIEQLLDIGSITQEKVRELIKAQRKPRTSKPEKPSIWRRDKNGKRYCQVPPIDDEHTGVALQQMMDSEGKSAQQIVSEAIALRQAFIKGRLDWVSDSQEDEEVIEDSSLEVAQNDHDNQPTVEIDNLSEDYVVFSDSIIFNSITTQQTVQSLSAPVMTIVEAKNENIISGLGECVAEMVASQIFNQRQGIEIPVIYGAVTTGTAWRFLMLRETKVSIEKVEYYINQGERILGIIFNPIAAYLAQVNFPKM